MAWQRSCATTTRPTVFSRGTQEIWHAAPGVLKPEYRPRDGHSPMQVLRHRRQPGIAIGPVHVLDSRGMQLPPQDRRGGGRRRAPALTRAWSRRNGATQAEQQARAGLDPVRRHPGGSWPHDADPTLRADTQARSAGRSPRNTRPDYVGARGPPGRLTDSHLAAARDMRYRDANPRPVDRPL